jgi:hypothetical protein
MPRKIETELKTEYMSLSILGVKVIIINVIITIIIIIIIISVLLYYKIICEFTHSLKKIG